MAASTARAEFTNRGFNQPDVAYDEASSFYYWGVVRRWRGSFITEMKNRKDKEVRTE